MGPVVARRQLDMREDLYGCLSFVTRAENCFPKDVLENLFYKYIFCDFLCTLQLFQIYVKEC